MITAVKLIANANAYAAFSVSIFMYGEELMQCYGIISCRRARPKPDFGCAMSDGICESGRVPHFARIGAGAKASGV